MNSIFNDEIPIIFSPLWYSWVLIVVFLCLVLIIAVASVMAIIFFIHVRRNTPTPKEVFLGDDCLNKIKTYLDDALTQNLEIKFNEILDCLKEILDCLKEHKETISQKNSSFDELVNTINTKQDEIKKCLKESTKDSKIEAFVGEMSKNLTSFLDIVKIFISNDKETIEGNNKQILESIESIKNQFDVLISLLGTRPEYDELSEDDGDGSHVDTHKLLLEVLNKNKNKKDPMAWKEKLEAKGYRVHWFTAVSQDMVEFKTTGTNVNAALALIECNDDSLYVVPTPNISRYNRRALEIWYNFDSQEEISGNLIKITTIAKAVKKDESDDCYVTDSTKGFLEMK